LFGAIWRWSAARSTHTLRTEEMKQHPAIVIALTRNGGAKLTG